MKGKFTTSLWK